MIRNVEVFDLEVPLKVPYHTAIADIKFFTALVAVIKNDTGREGLGECTTVLGYSWEGPEDAWQFAQAQGPALVGLQPDEAKVKLEPLVHKFPFSSTAFLTAVEVMEGSELLSQPSQRMEMPLVGIVNINHASEAQEKVESLLAAGYSTLKVKAGFEVTEDIKKARQIQAIVGDRAVIRIDANQGYNFDQAKQFVLGVDPSNVELFEQPFGNDEWEPMIQLSKISPLPLMLDESIYGLEEVERTAKERCASWIKFKLMKSASAQQLASGVRLAQKHDIKVIYGNGVATEIGCYHEALVAAHLGIKTAGENNGFLKPVAPVCEQPLPFSNGHLVLEPGFQLKLDRERVMTWAKRHAKWEM